MTRGCSALIYAAAALTGAMVVESSLSSM